MDDDELLDLMYYDAINWYDFEVDVTNPSIDSSGLAETKSTSEGLEEFLDIDYTAITRDCSA